MTDAWPPEPGDIDLSDPDWLTVGQAAGKARLGERSIRQLVADHDISIRIGGRRWISHRRLMACLLLQGAA